MGVVSLKILLSWFIVFASYLIDEKTQEDWLDQVARSGVANAPRTRNRWFKGLLNPLFVISLLITVVFFWFSEGAQGVKLFYLVARPVAVMLLIHFGFQFLPIEVWAQNLTQNSRSVFASGLAFAISVLKNPLDRGPLKVERQY